MSFDLCADSLESMILNKLDVKNSTYLREIVEDAELEWPFKNGEFILDIPADKWLIKFMKHYEEDVQNKYIVLGEIENKDLILVPSTARGTSNYTADVITKEENLVEYLTEEYEGNIVFTSFTISSKRTKDVYTAFKLFKDAVNNIISKVQQKQHLGRRPDYLWAIEPHKSGYIHLHMIFFEDFIPKFEKIAEWWADNYMDGRADKEGVDWEFIDSLRGKKRVAGDITKYVVKTLSFKDFEDVDQVSKDRRLLWLGLLYFTNRRSWSYSQDVRKWMSGLVKGIYNSIDEEELWIFRIGGFVLNKREYVYLGNFSMGELSDLKEDGDFNFSTLYEMKYLEKCEKNSNGKYPHEVDDSVDYSGRMPLSLQYFLMDKKGGDLNRSFDGSMYESDESDNYEVVEI